MHMKVIKVKEADLGQRSGVKFKMLQGQEDHTFSDKILEYMIYIPPSFI